MDVNSYAVGSTTSLMSGLFDHSVELFKFFSSMVDMPKECEQYRLQLMIEYNRILAWGKAIGLIDVPHESHVAISLGTNAIELCDIISRIGDLLRKFKAITSRWKEELGPYQGVDQHARETKALDRNVAADVSRLALEYEKTGKERDRLRMGGHITKWMAKRAADAMEIVAHPSRIRWVMVDKEAFEALLKDLHVLVERIHELMGNYHQGKIQDITDKIYREMVLLRDDVNDLKNLLSAINSLSKTQRDTESAGKTSRDEKNETIRDLLLLKEISSISDMMLVKIKDGADFNIEQSLGDLEGRIKVKCYDTTTLEKHFSTRGLEVTQGSVPKRQRGLLIDNEIKTEVWIEWKKMNTKITIGSVQHKESRLRTLTLAEMLHNRRPCHLYSPTCIGFIDADEKHRKYGWIYRMPEVSGEHTTLKSLHSVLGQNEYKPYLGQRISLAWRLASSLMYLHAANWIHKGINSDNIIFAFNEDKYDIEKPTLSGFEYSRPQTNETTSGTPDERWDIYKWPKVQNEVPKTFNSRKTYDIYSLGLVLLEIAHWKALHKILCLKRWPEPTRQSVRIRGWLLGEEKFAPFGAVNPLDELRDIAGDKYWKAVKCCLVAHGEEGMRIPEGSDQGSTVGVELQEAFTQLVVEPLKDISID